MLNRDSSQHTEEELSEEQASISPPRCSLTVRPHTHTAHGPAGWNTHGTGAGFCTGVTATGPTRCFTTQWFTTTKHKSAQSKQQCKKKRHGQVTRQAAAPGNIRAVSPSCGEITHLQHLRVQEKRQHVSSSISTHTIQTQELPIYPSI